MNVKKIFITLIVVVACVIIGALVLNVLLQNASRSVVNAVEAQLFKATGLEFDFNGDATKGSNETKFSDSAKNGGAKADKSTKTQKAGGEVDGWK